MFFATVLFLNPNIAEKFLANLQKVGGWFQRMTSKEARTAYNQVQDIKAKFLDALAGAATNTRTGRSLPRLKKTKKKPPKRLTARVG